MIAGEETLDIAATPAECFAFVLDLDRYREADHKIGRVSWLRERDSVVEVRYSTRFMGVPGPPVTHTVEVVPDERIDVRSKPDSLDGRLSAFHGWFTFDDNGDGTTRVTHREELHLKGPARLLEPVLGPWLEKDTPQELRRMKQLLEEG